jgi:hypothetical protein
MTKINPKSEVRTAVRVGKAAAKTKWSKSYFSEAKDMSRATGGAGNRGRRTLIDKERPVD